MKLRCRWTVLKNQEIRRIPKSVNLGVVRVYQVSLKYCSLLFSFIKTQLLTSSHQVGGSTAILSPWCMWAVLPLCIFFWPPWSPPLLLLLTSRRHLLHLDCLYLSLYSFVILFISSTNQYPTLSVHAGKNSGV